MPFSTAHFPATMTLSARWAPHNKSAARGSPAPENRSSSSENSARSACVPARRVPISVLPRHLAEPSVAQRKASKWVIASAPEEPLHVHGLSDFLNEIEQSVMLNCPQQGRRERRLLPRRGLGTIHSTANDLNRAMRNARTRCAKPGDLVVIKMNAMGKLVRSKSQPCCSK